MIIRTIEEIHQKIEEGFQNDRFGFGVVDIIYALPFEEAKQYFKKEFLEKPDAEEEFNKDHLKSKADVLEKMEDYLSFAYEKARGERGLSADRSIHHYIAWAWLIDDDFYKFLEKEYETNFYPYGIKILESIEAWINEQKAQAVSE